MIPSGTTLVSLVTFAIRNQFVQKQEAKKSDFGGWWVVVYPIPVTTREDLNFLWTFVTTLSIIWITQINVDC